MFEQAGQILFEQIQSIGYRGVLLATFAENIIPPIPSELVLPFSWFLASQWTLNIFLVIIIAAFGSTLGTVPYFFIGRIFHKTKIIYWTEKYGKYIWMSKKNMEDIFSKFDKNNKKIIFFGRFVPGARALISLPAGSANMNFGQFMIYTFGGTLIWSALLCTIGYILAEKRDEILHILSYYETAVLVALILISIGFLLKNIIRKALKKYTNIDKKEK
jgi:membrane protein DedA with SNARE-associated domain